MFPKHFSQSDKYEIKKLHKSQFTDFFSNWGWKYNLGLRQKPQFSILFLNWEKLRSALRAASKIPKSPYEF